MKSLRPARLRLICVAALLIGGSGVACSNTLAPTASTLNDTWMRLDEVAGSSERWNLVVHGSSISGAGTWTGEACCDGTLTLSGTISHDSIHVDVARVANGGPTSANGHEQFDGILVSRGLLQGMASFENGPADAERLQKQ
jgi:hypothetical protein